MAVIEVVSAVVPAVVTGGFGVWIAKISIDVRRQITPSNGVRTAEHIEAVAFDVAVIKQEQVACRKELAKQSRTLAQHTASDQANFEEIRSLLSGDGTDGTSK